MLSTRHYDLNRILLFKFKCEEKDSNSIKENKKIRKCIHFRSPMSSIAFIFDIIFSGIITLIFLYRCGNYRRQHPITTIAVFIAWFFSVLFVFILPLDISLVCSISVFRCLDHCFQFSGSVSRLFDTENTEGKLCFACRSVERAQCLLE